MSSPETAKCTSSSPPEISSCKKKIRGRKRRRIDSEGSIDIEDGLPENALELEKNLHISAFKNNLDDVSVKKILRKVVKNDHVLALVKLKEEEENSSATDPTLKPKLTRAKVKELMKVSPKSAPWNLDLELTPIKQLPVKTRPEVTALIAQELQEDEDDEEYEPAHDEVPSDDDQTMESCSDVDSQPRTPATPNDSFMSSPKLLQDGPFKVPQDVPTAARRKLQLEEEATIALRTRSKLSLSATSIEHIESSFIPPDDLPMLDVDDLWNEFLNECLNPAQTSKHEDDDETDPEYNVAADQDAHDDDEEALENTIIKISKKELNDLVTELFNVMPDNDNNDSTANMNKSDVNQSNGSFDVTQERVGCIGAGVVSKKGVVQTRWDGKQEPMSDEEVQLTINEGSNENGAASRRFSIGKTEPEDDDVTHVVTTDVPDKEPVKNKTMFIDIAPKPVSISMQEEAMTVLPPNVDSSVPAVLQHLQQNKPTTTRIQVDPTVKMLPDQILLLQQQLRQHIQLATSNFLQLFVHPVHWSMAPSYKEYLDTLVKLSNKRSNSVVKVCNLNPAWELVQSWEAAVSQKTPENVKMVEFIQKDVERVRRRIAQNSLYKGDFEKTFMEVVSNSTVFLYPYLLPPIPYRPETVKRSSYLKSEDDLIALGLDQFWEYVEMNVDMYKRGRASHRTRWGLAATVKLLTLHMFPWFKPTTLMHHVQNCRRSKEGPIHDFLTSRKVEPVKHKLLPFNPKLTLYEQPENELPRAWVRYLAKSSKRFRSHLYSRLSKSYGEPAEGVAVDMGKQITIPQKNPLPIHFTREIVCHRQNLLPKKPAPTYENDKIDVQLRDPASDVPKTKVLIPAKMYSVVQTTSGAYLVPVTDNTSTVNVINRPIAAPEEAVAHKVPEHCNCCVLLRKICKIRQSIITEYFTVKNSNKRNVKICPCRMRRFPKVTSRLRMLISFYKNDASVAWDELSRRVENECKVDENTDINLNEACNIEDQAFVNNYQIRLNMRMVARNQLLKKRVFNLFSKYDPEAKSPVKLAGELLALFDVELVDMYKEFLGFLTPVQADALNKFRYYFIQTCLKNLIKKVEDHVPDKEKRHSIFVKLESLLSSSITACEMCTKLLTMVDDNPVLAKYIFSLFPHRKLKSNVNAEATQPEAETPKDREETQEQAVVQQNEPTCLEMTIIEKPQESLLAVHYEGDRSSSEHEADNQSESEEELITVKIEEDDNDNITNEIDTPELTISKTEVQDYNESSNMSALVMSEDEIKAEEPEWNRQEDKLILEILKENLTPEDRQEKSLLEIIEDEEVLRKLTENLIDKSETDIKGRVLYLLGILVRSER